MLDKKRAAISLICFCILAGIWLYFFGVEATVAMVGGVIGGVVLTVGIVSLLLR